MDDNIKNLPSDIIIAEKASQRNRILLEVMQQLWGMLPEKKMGVYDFALADGTRCWLKQFSAPNERDGELQYGFDVIFEDRKPLDHIEFLVKSSGFGGNL